nr:hypothetical protein [Cytophagales bacterium]
MKNIICIGIVLLFGPLFTPKTQSDTAGSRNTASLLPANSDEAADLAEIIYESFDTTQQILTKPILKKALTGYLRLVNEGIIDYGKPLTVIDFSVPSTVDRLWVIDMENLSVKFQSLVAHGRNSGDKVAKNFSNQHSSYMSSLGFYRTGETYQGAHGYSLRLDGLEVGINDQARSRAIVIHGADYVNEQFISSTGRLGRSLGCPALPMESHVPIIDLIKDQSAIFIYADAPDYLAHSAFLKPLG